jgi:hypothetical protein
MEIKDVVLYRALDRRGREDISYGAQECRQACQGLVLTMRCMCGQVHIHKRMPGLEGLDHRMMELPVTAEPSKVPFLIRNDSRVMALNEIFTETWIKMKMPWTRFASNLTAVNSS